jgi:hypothetical protein
MHKLPSKQAYYTPPAQLLQRPLPEIFQWLEMSFGSRLYDALNPETHIEGPFESEKNTAWVKKVNTVGINVRTVGNFWQVIPYAFTLPRAQQAIHLLPIFEPGVVASLYGPSSWNINPEFYNEELGRNIPQLNTVEAQLRVVINILHLMGKAVAMDVIPHTDRYSEAALANPWLFEWLQRKDMQLLRHDEQLYHSIIDLLWQHLQQEGPAVDLAPLPANAQVFFEEWPEEQRLRALFGPKYDYHGRLNRRKKMVALLYAHGYETVPATMGPPYRGIEVDPDPAAKVTDEDGREWRDYRITRPEPFSRVFGPLARFKLYAAKKDHSDWELDFEHPMQDNWAYVCRHYAAIQDQFGFDFMRGDMSHVQMRPDGVPRPVPPYYDLLGEIKTRIGARKPWFGYFAESFLAPPGEMAYGDECDHLEASLADSTLGDLQSEPVGTEKFIREFAQYDHWLRTRRFAPNFTLMTADKDDPRFDAFYLNGNELRYFIGLFLTDMPAYMGLGFECRDPHPTPAPNEHYTKLYVFQMPDGPKGTRGPYQWGGNTVLYENLARQKEMADALWPDIGGAPTRWCLPPDPKGQQKVIAWTDQPNEKYLFVVNFDTKNSQKVAIALATRAVTCIFSSKTDADISGRAPGDLLLEAGECLIFETSK